MAELEMADFKQHAKAKSDLFPLMKQKIEEMIEPFTLADIQSNPSLVSSKAENQVKSMPRSVGNVNVVKLAVFENSNLKWVSFFHKPGQFDYFSGDFGKNVANFELPVSNQSDPIGFGRVTLAYDGYKIQFRQAEDGKWSADLNY